MIVLLGGRWFGQVSLEQTATEFESRRKADFLAAVEQVRLGRVNRIALYDSRDTDEKVSQLLNLPSLNELVLESSDITEVGLGYVGRIPKLRIYYFNYMTRLGDAGLRQLSGTPSLETLVIVQSGVSAKGIYELRTMKSLRTLVLFEDSSEAEMPGYAQSMVEAVSSLHGIELLAVGGRWLTDELAAQIGDALQETHVIQLRTEPPTPYNAVQLIREAAK